MPHGEKKLVFCENIYNFCVFKNKKAAVWACLARLHTPLIISIICYMKLLEQILSEMGADTLKSFTVIPRFGGYFRSVKSINEFGENKIVLVLRKEVVTVTGEKLEVGKYFEEDIFIKGEIKEVKIDK